MSPRRQVTYSRRPNHAARSAHARGDRMFRTYDTSYIQPKRSNVPHYVFLAVLALLGIGILWFVGSSVASCVSPKVELLAEGQQATITINEGASANTVGSALVDAKLVGSSKEFTERVKDLDAGSDLKPGTYTFAGGATVDDIISALRNGPVSPDRDRLGGGKRHQRAHQRRFLQAGGDGCQRVCGRLRLLGVCGHKQP